ncbi:antibiotic biosynthesis monooxygenase family protein [Lampropedia aestuarii]|uniref:antibiotic biosynthesis monooxygenase family protein n=1 Tax=Lampropedia aestuarii TaxID=2562762 RepID=UPI0024684D45|nr:antibiotic biosynthesis monooxygenase [Lampropedia aestuarii]MDH5859131.1 antibiotic biosynthesis monooxygenase [Lampropedia aestuarii]
MILEVAPLHVLPHLTTQFEAAFAQAQRIIASMPGYLSHELGRCTEHPNQYILLVRWQTLADHEVGFRQSSQYLQWKQLLHHFYDPFPTVLHYATVAQSATSPIATAQP